jgi:hypothetical protein
MSSAFPEVRETASSSVLAVAKERGAASRRAREAIVARIAKGRS